MRREVILSPSDVALLDHLARHPSLTAACRSLGFSTDRGRYRLLRLGRALGTSAVVGARGGAERGRTELTAAGRTLLDAGAGTVVGPAAPRAASERLSVEGTWAPGAVPTVRVANGLRLAVAFRARPGERVRVEADPASVLLATGRFASSARNVLSGRVVRIRRTGPGTGGAQLRAEVRVGGWTVPVAVTGAAVRDLRLVPGRRVYLYLKATALRRADRPTRGSPRK